MASTLGRISLIILILVLFYDVAFATLIAAVNVYGGTLGDLLKSLDMMIIRYGGTEPVYSSTETLLTNLFSWGAFIFTNSLALAVLVAVDIVKEAFESSS